MSRFTTEGRARPGGRFAALALGGSLQSSSVVCPANDIAIAPSGGRSGAARRGRAERVDGAMPEWEGKR